MFPDFSTITYKFSNFSRFSGWAATELICNAGTQYQLTIDLPAVLLEYSNQQQQHVMRMLALCRLHLHHWVWICQQQVVLLHYTLQQKKTTRKRAIAKALHLEGRTT